MVVIRLFRSTTECVKPRFERPSHELRSGIHHPIRKSPARIASSKIDVYRRNRVLLRTSWSCWLCHRIHVASVIGSCEGGRTDGQGLRKLFTVAGGCRRWSWQYLLLHRGGDDRYESPSLRVAFGVCYSAVVNMLRWDLCRVDMSSFANGGTSSVSWFGANGPAFLPPSIHRGQAEGGLESIPPTEVE